MALQQLTASTDAMRAAFLAAVTPAILALLLPTVPDTPLLIRFKTGLAPHADDLRAVLALSQFKGNIKTGTQNAEAGASAPRLSASPTARASRRRTPFRSHALRERDH